MHNVKHSITRIGTALFLVALILPTPTAHARERMVRIVDQTRESDPGAIHVHVDSIGLDASGRNLSVTWMVTANCDRMYVYVVDFAAEQQRGKEVLETRDNTWRGEDVNWCGFWTTSVLTAPEGSVFRPGPLTVEVTASACGGGCTNERLLTKAVAGG